MTKITQDDRQRKVLKVSEEWKIEKIILSWLINIIIHSKKIQKNFPLIIRRGFFGKNFFLILENKPPSLRGGGFIFYGTEGWAGFGLIFAWWDEAIDFGRGDGKWDVFLIVLKTSICLVMLYDYTLF